MVVAVAFGHGAQEVDSHADILFGSIAAFAFDGQEAVEACIVQSGNVGVIVDTALSERNFQITVVTDRDTVLGVGVNDILGKNICGNAEQ